MPLIALIQGEEFDAENLEESHRKSTEFRCPDPECNDAFIPVMGFVKIKHFRHKTKTHHYNEPETPEHMALKRYVKNACDTLQIQCKLEPYLFHKNQKRNPDCIITFDEEYQKRNNIKGVVVECQCAQMTSNIYQERNIFYLDNGYIPIWIFGDKNYSKRIFSDLGAGRKLKSIEKIVQSDYLKIFYYHENILYETNFQHIDNKKNLLNVKSVNETSIKNILDYVCESKNSIFEGGNRCGFFIKSNDKWVSDPKLKFFKPNTWNYMPNKYAINSSRWQDILQVKFIEMEKQYGEKTQINNIYERICEYITCHDGITPKGIETILEYRNLKNEYNNVVKLLHNSKVIEWKPMKGKFSRAREP